MPRSGGSEHLENLRYYASYTFQAGYSFHGNVRGKKKGSSSYFFLIKLELAPPCESLFSRFVCLLEAGFLPCFASYDS